MEKSKDARNQRLILAVLWLGIPWTVWAEDPKSAADHTSEDKPAAASSSSSGSVSGPQAANTPTPAAPQDSREVSLSKFRAEMEKLNDDGLIQFVNLISKARDLTPEKFDALVDSLPALDADPDVDKAKKKALKDLFRSEHDKLSERPETDLNRVATDLLVARLGGKTDKAADPKAKEAIANGEAKNQVNQLDEQLKRAIEERVNQLLGNAKGELERNLADAKNQIGNLEKEAADLAKQNAAQNAALDDALRDLSNNNADTGSGLGSGDTGSSGSGDTGSGSGGGGSGGGSSSGGKEGNQSRKNNDSSKDRAQKFPELASNSSPAKSTENKDTSPPSTTGDFKKTSSAKTDEPKPQVEPTPSVTEQSPSDETPLPASGTSARKLLALNGPTSTPNSLPANSPSNGAVSFDAATSAPQAATLTGAPSSFGGVAGDDRVFNVATSAGSGYAATPNYNYIKTSANDWGSSTGGSSEILPPLADTDGDGESSYSGKKKIPPAPVSVGFTSPASTQSTERSASRGMANSAPVGVFRRAVSLLKGVCDGPDAAKVGICGALGARTAGTAARKEPLSRALAGRSASFGRKPAVAP